MAELNPGETTDCFIETFTGRRFHFNNPSPYDVDLEDIAHSLSMICRYTGHLPVHYSVAEHSVLCALLAPHAPQSQMPGLTDQDKNLITFDALLHDAAETYVGDMNGPLKSFLSRHRGYGPTYKEVELRIQDVIYQKLDPVYNDDFAYSMGAADGAALSARIVKWTDWVACAIEAKAMMPSGGRGWHLKFAIPTEFEGRERSMIRNLSPSLARIHFLRMYHQLKDAILGQETDSTAEEDRSSGSEARHCEEGLGDGQDPTQECPRRTGQVVGGAGCPPECGCDVSGSAEVPSKSIEEEAEDHGGRPAK